MKLELNADQSTISERDGPRREDLLDDFNVEVAAVVGGPDDAFRQRFGFEVVVCAEKLFSDDGLHRTSKSGKQGEEARDRMPIREQLRCRELAERGVPDQYSLVVDHQKLDTVLTAVQQPVVARRLAQYSEGLSRCLDVARAARLWNDADHARTGQRAEQAHQLVTFDDLRQRFNQIFRLFRAAKETTLILINSGVMKHKFVITKKLFFKATPD
jgi:hypothetical protein